MGSATSHGIQLAPIRTTTYSTQNYHGRRINRYAHPHNRVLPPPVAGQRLRTTDNGSILLERGTIRGQRAEGSPLPPDVDPEVLAVLQRRSDKLVNNGNSTIGRKWQSSSDPNITYSLQLSEANGKSKSRKKNRAPEPPISSIPRKTHSNRRKKNGGKTKNPAPPPPPLINNYPSKSKDSYAIKNISVQSRGNDSTESSDIRLNESRHLIFEKRNSPTRKETVPKILNDNRISRNEAFAEEIRQATRKLADRTQQNSTTVQKAENIILSPKQYYFPDVEIKRSSQIKEKREKGCEVKIDQANDSNKNKKQTTSNRIIENNTKKDQVDFDRMQKQNRVYYRQLPRAEWLSANSVESCSNSSDTLPSLSGSDDDINLKLKPTLPRRQTELPQFSPAEAWKFLSVQHLDSVLSSEGGDEEEERIWRISNLTSSKKVMPERCEDSGISPDAESPILTKEFRNHNHSIMIGHNSWIPQQDLLEDSDSNEFEDFIENRRFTKVPVKLTLPNEMFSSNLVNKTVNHNDPNNRENRFKGKKVIGVKNIRQGNGLSNLKKTLGMRSKSPYTERLDSNWVLNQHGRKSKLVGNYNYVNSGGKKQLESLIFGVRKENRQEQEPDNYIRKNGLRRKFSFYSTEGHVIYLPEYETVDLNRRQMRKRDVERNDSRRRKKTMDKKLIDMTEAKLLDNDEWIFQMQKQHKRERDREKINIRDKLKKYQTDVHPLNDTINEYVQPRSQSYDELAKRTESPLLGGWISTPLRLNDFCPPKANSSTSSSSREIISSNNRRQYTEGNKWVRRQRQPPQNRNFSPTRPEPEGGGASSDEICHRGTDDTTTDNSNSPVSRKPSVYTQIMEVAKQEELRLKAEEPTNIQSIPETSGNITNTESKSKLVGGKEGTESSWKFKSGLPNQNSIVKNVPNKSTKQAEPPAKTFYMELEERMKQIARSAEEKCQDDSKISKKTNGIVKTLLPNVIVNEGGYKSVIQLSSVQPFSPNRGYRPVPFKLPAVQKDDERSNETVVKTPIPS